MQFSRQIILIVALLTLVMSAGALAYLLLRPDPLVIDVEENGAGVYFASDHRFILTPFDCIEVRWRVGNIQTVFLNQRSQVGEGKTHICLTPFSPPTLVIRLQDDSQQTYTLDVRSVFLHPLTLALFMIAAGSAWVASRRITQPRVGAMARHVVRLDALITVLGVLTLLHLAYVRTDLDDFALMVAPPLNVDLDDLGQRTMEEEAAGRSGRVRTILAVRNMTPPDATILIPFSIEHAPASRAVAYPRRFYWVGNIDAYLRRSVGNADQTFVQAARTNLAWLGEDDSLQPLYLILDEPVYEKLGLLGFAGIASEVRPVNDERWLLSIAPGVTPEEVEVAVLTIQRASLNTIEDFDDDDLSIDLQPQMGFAVADGRLNITLANTLDDDSVRYEVTLPEAMGNIDDVVLRL